MNAIERNDEVRLACPELTVLTDFVAGRLPAEARGAVEAHIAACTDCGARVAALGEVPTQLPTLPDRVSARKEPQQLRRGSSLDRYVIIDAVGVGGMGVVYSAYDPELDRKVALKLFRAYDGPIPMEERRTRLLREAQAMARIAHPNVVAVYDAGTFEQQVFLAMQFVEGRTLRAWLREQPRTVAEILSAFEQAGQGLAAAHAAGVVHRDFKPDNILVSRDGVVRVTDFGLARGANFVDLPAETPRPRRIPAGTALATPLTTAGSVMGTPGYMAPEQERGGVTDARTDQYGFCASLLEALTGQRPDAKSAFEGALSFEALPASVRRVVRKGLSTDPANRYESMSALLEALAVANMVQALRAPAAHRDRLLTYAIAAATAATAVTALILAWHAHLR
jgi:eukaryotic-like serine/threonine-protein kinase